MSRLAKVPSRGLMLCMWLSSPRTTSCHPQVTHADAEINAVCNDPYQGQLPCMDPWAEVHGLLHVQHLTARLHTS